jgi:hypothetical protein
MSMLILRLMEDVEVQLPTRARVTVPAPPRSDGGTYHDSLYGEFRPSLDTYREREILVPSPYSSSASSQGDADDGSDPRLTLIVLKGGAAYVVRQYWVENGRMHFTSGDGEQKLLPLERIDLSQTVRLNRERNVEFVLRSSDAIQ